MIKQLNTTQLGENGKHMHRIHRLHFIGIGGSGMNGIAEVMHNLGYAVSGSDMNESATTARLRGEGMTVHIGHDAGNISGADVVVKSTAIKDDNAEIVAARDARIPVISRAEMLAEIMRFRFGIAVSGTHGKTTTTSMLASVLGDAGFDPTYVIGGILNRAGNAAQLGKGQYLIAEADESDASFLHLTPVMSIVSNIEADHMETYDGDFNKLRQTFIDFLHRMPFYGQAVICLDDPVIAEMRDEIGRPITTYGMHEDADFRAENIAPVGLTMAFDAVFPSGERERMTVNMPGEHNVLNALSVIAVATSLEVPIDDIKRGLANFAGVGRRFQKRGELAVNAQSVPVYEDYGHHPTELRVVLEAARGAFPDKQIVAVFQPHRYSRTKDLFEDFSQVLSQYDKVVLTEVFAAGETPITGADGRALAASVRARGAAEPVFVPELTDIAEQVKRMLTGDEVVIVLGAGSIGKIAHELATLDEQVK